jgi:hypothetical protein
MSMLRAAATAWAHACMLQLMTSEQALHASNVRLGSCEAMCHGVPPLPGAEEGVLYVLKLACFPHHGPKSECRLMGSSHLLPKPSLHTANHNELQACCTQQMLAVPWTSSVTLGLRLMHRYCEAIDAQVAADLADDAANMSTTSDDDRLVHADAAQN